MFTGLPRGPGILRKRIKRTATYVCEQAGRAGWKTKKPPVAGRPRWVSRKPQRFLGEALALALAATLRRLM